MARSNNDAYRLDNKYKLPSTIEYYKLTSRMIAFIDHEFEGIYIAYVTNVSDDFKYMEWVLLEISDWETSTIKKIGVIITPFQPSINLLWESIINIEGETND